MTQEYRELVGVLVTFNKNKTGYRIDYQYRVKKGRMWGEWQMQYGMDWPVRMCPKSILQGLQDAFASATHAIWKRDGFDDSQTYLQLYPGFRPHDAGLAPRWGLWALL